MAYRTRMVVSYPTRESSRTYSIRLVSVFKVHPLCPFTAKERFVVFFCSVAFNFVWTAFMEYHRGKISVLFGGGRFRDERGAMFYLVKNIVTTLYAVLIRQIVICPCLYGPLIQAACEGDAPTGLWNGSWQA